LGIRDLFKPKERRSTTDGGSSLEFPSSWLSNLYGLRAVKSGAMVNEATALEATAVYRAVSLIAGQIATMPLTMYERAPTGRSEAVDHPLHYLLKYQPNPEITAFQFREMMQTHLLLNGNAYAEIERNFKGEVVALWPLTPSRVEPKRVRPSEKYPRGFLYYQVRLPNGSTQKLAGEQVLHIPGFGFDGLKGKSPVRIAREAIGLSLATEEFGSKFFGDGTHIAGVFEMEGHLSDEAYGRLKENLGGWKGLQNSHRVKILEDGLKYKQLGVPPEDAQFLETRKFQVTEIARIYGVPAHLLGDLDKATFSNIEHQGIEFVKYCLANWAKRWEQVTQLKLLVGTEKKKYYAEFNFATLERGDLKTRYEAYAQARQNGWLSANDIRRAENMNPIEGGDEYLVQVNMTPASKLVEKIDAQINLLNKNADSKVVTGSGSRSIEKRIDVEDPCSMALGIGMETRAMIFELRSKSSAAERSKLSVQERSKFAEAFQKIINNEVDQVREQLMKHTRDIGSFREWLQVYYNGLSDDITEGVLSTFRSFSELIFKEAAEEIEFDSEFNEEMENRLNKYVDGFVLRYTISSRQQIEALARDALTDGEASESIEKRLDDWRETRADREALVETTRLSGFISIATYALGGISYMRWVNSGSKSCPYCESLDGKIVGIESSFLDKGTEVSPDGADVMRVSSKITHPPLHKGCVCQIVAERK
jgi:HK97 family phage portal protein